MVLWFVRSRFSTFPPYYTSCGGVPSECCSSQWPPLSFSPAWNCYRNALGLPASPPLRHATTTPGLAEFCHTRTPTPLFRTVGHTLPGMAACSCATPLVTALRVLKMAISASVATVCLAGPRRPLPRSAACHARATPKRAVVGTTRCWRCLSTAVGRPAPRPRHILRPPRHRPPRHRQGRARHSSLET